MTNGAESFEYRCELNVFVLSEIRERPDTDRTWCVTRRTTHDSRMKHESITVVPRNAAMRTVRPLERRIMTEPSTSTGSFPVVKKNSDIVVGIDGSKGSCCALAWAMQEASLTGQFVNAVYGWTYSWDMGPEPEDEDGWRAIREQITKKLYGWAEIANEGIDFDMSKLKLTSVRASGSSALLRIGQESDQIVVGRRSLSPVARWFFGSVSSSIAEHSHVPVTVVRVPEYKENAVKENIHNALSDDLRSEPAASRPIVVGLDGSDCSLRALEFAARAAHYEKRQLKVLYCWQLKKLEGDFKDRVPSEDEAQEFASAKVQEWISKVQLPEDVNVKALAFHIAPGKGMIQASEDADRVVVGSRGLSGFDAHVLGSVSQYVLENATGTVTVVH